ncbi:MAG: TolC family protein [Planctomycetota bacterium]
MKKESIRIILIVLLIAAEFLTGCSAHIDNLISYPDEATSPSRPVSLQSQPLQPTTISEPTYGLLTINEAVSLALKHNPELAARQKMISIAEAQIVQAQLWPNPTIELETANIPANDFGSNKNEKTISIGQEISLGGKISARQKIAHKEKEIILLQYEAARLNLIAEVKKCFYSILLAQRRQKLLDQARQIAQNLLELTQKRVEARAALENELIRARLELSQTDTRLANVRTELILAQKKLNTLIGLKELAIEKYDDTLRDSYSLPPEKQLKTLVYTTHSELALRNKEKELAQGKLKLVQSERYPNIGVLLGYSRNSFDDDNLIKLCFSIPIPIFNHNQGNIKDAQININKAQDNYQATAQVILSELDATLLELKQAADQAREYQVNILPDAEKSLELTRTGYEYGKLSYLSLLEAQRTLAETQEVYLEIIGLLNSKATDLERLTGLPLESKE